MLLFAGLGNPGQNYAMNRHNIGFMAVDLLAERYGFPAWQKKSTALQSAGRIGTDKIILVKPQSYMNKSGLPVAEVARFHKILPDNIFVFHDDMDIDSGKVKVKFGGSNAGHNGIESIDKNIGKNYTRIRIGIGHPKINSTGADHVLDNFSHDEKQSVEEVTKNIIESLSILIKKDLDLFSSKVNQK